MSDIEVDGAAKEPRCPDEELVLLAEKAHERLRDGGDVLVAVIPHLVDEIQEYRSDGSVGVDREHHDRVAKSRRRWIDAATSALPDDWSGTPDDLREEMLRQTARRRELEAALSESMQLLSEAKAQLEAFRIVATCIGESWDGREPQTLDEARAYLRGIESAIDEFSPETVPSRIRELEAEVARLRRAAKGASDE